MEAKGMFKLPSYTKINFLKLDGAISKYTK